MRRRRSEDEPLVDRVTNVAFMAALVVTAATFFSYGPEAACRHIADVIAACVPPVAQTDAPAYAGAMLE